MKSSSGSLFRISGEGFFSSSGEGFDHLPGLVCLEMTDTGGREGGIWESGEYSV